MVVLVLMTILAAMILPEMKGTFEEELLRSTSRQLTRAFSLAYSQSVTVNQRHRVRIDAQAGRYCLERLTPNEEMGSGFVAVKDLPGAEGKLDTRISIHIQDAREGAVRAREPSESGTPQPTENRRDRAEVIAFYPDGTADARNIILRDRAGFGLALRLNPITARVSIVRLERQ